MTLALVFPGCAPGPTPDTGQPIVGPPADLAKASSDASSGGSPDGPDGPGASCGNGVVESGEECDAPADLHCVSCRCASGYHAVGGVCQPIDECAIDNGGCGDARYFSCTSVPGQAPSCSPIDLCKQGNGGCGDPRYFRCQNVVGAPSTCTAVDLCQEQNGGCGDPRYYACTTVVGAEPRCAAINLCLTANGGCGEPRYFECWPQVGADPMCSPINLCQSDNGGCGDPRYFSCASNVGAEPSCAVIDLCQVHNGGCGEERYWKCTNNVGAPPTCSVIDQCLAQNGGCGDPQYFRCLNVAGAPPACSPIDQCLTSNGGCGHPALYACQGGLGKPPTCTARPEPLLGDSRVSGVVSGLGGGKGTVVLGNDAYLASQPVVEGQAYRFDRVPDGHYFLKLEVSGFQTPREWKVQVTSQPQQALGPAKGPAQGRGGVAPAAGAPSLDFRTQPLPTDHFAFHWEDSQSRAGRQETAYINKPHQIVPVQGQPLEVIDAAAAATLAHDYNVILADDEVPWTQEYASRLLTTERQLPQKIRDKYGPQDLVASKWVLTRDVLADDVAITWDAGGNTVRISADAFVDAAPRLVLLDGLRATFFSKRLHHALTRYVTHDGTDSLAVEKILSQRYGCATVVPDFAALTAPTTAETAASFQPFHPEELVAIIDMYEEMPSGLHSVNGLKYLVRRKDGMPHPIYPSAAAVAWARPDLFPSGSYIEFMEVTFKGDQGEAHRLILHEKAHFMWGYLYSQQLKDDWIQLGGWYRDPKARDGWSTTREVEFVSAYAHQHSPDEDMAESVAFFVLDPDALRSRSLPKYEFIRDRVMHGTQFIARVKQDLQFQVLNLYPDYDYPGKIKRVDITVDGGPQADKSATVEVELDTADKVFEGAASGFFRLYSPIGTYTDVWLQPVDLKGTVLRGSFTVSRYAKSGYWTTDQITLTDAVGNQRMEGLEDFGWKLLIDNPLEDVTAPKYVPGSMRLTVSAEDYVEHAVSHPVQRVHAAWQVKKAGLMRASSPCYATLVDPAAVSVYSMESYGTYDAGSATCSADFIITEFNRSGAYSVASLMMYDQAGNIGRARFTGAGADDTPVTVQIATANPDSVMPEVSLNDDLARGLHKILVSAEPTHPQAPDGETIVNIRFQARDDKSGVGRIAYRLLDPQGISHAEYYYGPGFYDFFYVGDPTVWVDNTATIILPVGSAPGTWGLQDLTVYDHAGNRRYLNFVELLQFDVAK